ncbi:hypothetical protein PX554_19945 [Sphingomonas sp. H39-1-10]|uniref:hypothetical protein n=1 Tax=Sphingomonas pollutisoli TaxID=3030829 RepID=UPI0023B98497|nr:hypothetical protein [Sphingomonas pollutisoli]MDF0490405.1 hypothetical protein [Sphingomonas pollutisoli]
MTDFQTSIVILPAIPAQDLTPIERLLLATMFDHRIEGDRIHFHSWTGMREKLVLTLAELHGAIRETRGLSPAVLRLLGDSLDLALGCGSHLVFDLEGFSWEHILLDIVRRSATLDHLAIVTGYAPTQAEHRPEAIGGLVIVVTADSIAGKSLDDCLAELLQDPTDDMAEPLQAARSGLPLLHVVCRNCGGGRIVRDACATWDTPSGKWVLASVHDCDFCEACNAENVDLARWAPVDGAASSLWPPIAGDRVRVVDGPHEGREGLVRVKTIGRLFVTLDMTGDELCPPTFLMPPEQLVVLSLANPTTPRPSSRSHVHGQP